MFGLTPYMYRNHTPYADAFRELEKGFFRSGEFSAFNTDVKDNGKAFELIADLPGFRKEDIKIDVKGDVLSIRAERKEEKSESSEEGKYVFRERSYGSYARSFDISSIDTKGIKASYSDGVLHLDLPKKEELVPEERKIEIG